MPLESILHKITHNANLEAKRITQEARKDADKISQQAKKEAEDVYQQILDKEKTILLAQKQKSLVNARLEAKKSLLKAKQELIDQVFEGIKSQIPKGKIKEYHVLPDKTKEAAEDIDFFLSNLRHDYETEIAIILFT
jgi:V/A-type H+-transporting ATPase subunit E